MNERCKILERGKGDTGMVQGTVMNAVIDPVMITRIAMDTVSNRIMDAVDSMCYDHNGY